MDNMNLSQIRTRTTLRFCLNQIINWWKCSIYGV